MSLISTKNLIAPFRNKVHLSTIVLITLAFAALRFSGGDVKVVKNDSPYLKNNSYTYTNKETKNNYDADIEKKDKDNSNSLVDIERELGL